MQRRVSMVAILIAAGATVSVGARPANSTGPEPGTAVQLGNAITYQGKLEKNGVPASGNFNFKFHLYDAAINGVEINVPGVSLSNQPVANGIFTVALDFGANPFNGQARWIGIEIQGTGDPSYTTLSPRQAVTAAPYAIYALNAAASSQWVSDGFGNITYNGGAAGVTGQSTHLATGKGVFFDGGNPNGATVYGYNYDILQPLPLYLNPTGGDVLCVGGNLGAGTTAPSAPLHAERTGNQFGPTNQAAINAFGFTSNPLEGSRSCMGVYATSTDGRAVAGFSTNNWGVSGDCTSAGTYGILGTPNEGVFGLSPNASRPGGHFVNTAAGGYAIWAEGKAKVNVLEITGGDLAEPFEVTSAGPEGGVEPGMVVVIDDERPGKLCVANRAYDGRVAGVISGANGLDAGVVLKAEGLVHGDLEYPIAMSGRAWCWADAAFGPIRPGDRLTTSVTPGHAMRAERSDASGAVIGKAMTALAAGRGLVLVLVNLQ